MKFNFSDILYANVQGNSLLGELPNGRNNSELTERGAQALGVLKTLLKDPEKDASRNDSVSHFYSDLATPSTPKRNLAINKNTADRHGRT